MKTSDLRPFAKINAVFKIETKTDELDVITNEYQFERHIEQNGNQFVVYDSKNNTYRIPAFTQAQAKFRSAKLAYCEKFGCE
jgi:hypothetical protein